VQFGVQFSDSEGNALICAWTATKQKEPHREYWRGS